MHVCWIGRRSCRRCVHIPKHPHKKNYYEQRCKMVEHNLETLQNEKYLCKKTVEFFLDEEERSVEDEKSYEEDSVLKEEETKGDGNNTPVQKKLGLDINMIGARKETLGKTRSQNKEMSSPKMNPWKEQISQWKIGSKEPA